MLLPHDQRQLTKTLRHNARNFSHPLFQLPLQPLAIITLLVPYPAIRPFPLRPLTGQALVDGGATSPDHVHDAATAAALAGDLAQAEELLLRGGLAAAQFVFTSLSLDGGGSGGGGQEAAAIEALIAPPPAGPADEDGAAAAAAVVGGGRGTGGEEGTGVRAALKQPGGESRRLLVALRRLAPLMDADRHVVVVMLHGDGLTAASGTATAALAATAAAGDAAGAGGGAVEPAAGKGADEGGSVLAAPRLVEGVCAEACAVLGVDKKLLVALPADRRAAGAQQATGGSACVTAVGLGTSGSGSGDGEEGQGEGRQQQGAAWDAWRAGGRVWGAGTAVMEEAVLVAQALCCATGALWTAQAVNI